jgi:enoyl-CoA hydratase/carnithine racemase
VEDSNIVLQEYDQDQKIFVLSLNRPKQLNAINKNLLNELRHHLENISIEKNLGALIINSRLMKAFCTGIDVTFVQRLSNEEAADFFSELAMTFEQLSNFPSPTIAVVNGYAFGAGADLALACDLRIAGSSAHFRFPGPQFGVILGTHRLVNEVGHSVARKLALSNQIIVADKALQYGLIHEITEDESAFGTAFTWAKNLTRMPKYTFKSIREICEYHSLPQTKKNTPSDFARQSVEQGDFKERFTQYVERIKESKRK